MSADQSRPGQTPPGDIAATAQKIREQLFVALFSDTLDLLGFRHQAFAPQIRPLDEALVLVGRARTGLYRDVYHLPRGHNPYALEIALIDDLKPGEVPVLACGSSGRIAPWGELLTTASRARGATGCVTDGLVRDIKAIRALQFPVFHGGIGPLDSKGRGEVCAIDVPIECARRHGQPGRSGVRRRRRRGCDPARDRGRSACPRLRAGRKGKRDRSGAAPRRETRRRVRADRGAVRGFGAMTNTFTPPSRPHSARSATARDPRARARRPASYRRRRRR